MSTRSIFRVIYGGFILLIVVIGLVATGMFVNFRHLRRADEMQLALYELANELWASSEELTKCAQAYVQTGNTHYIEQYNHVLDVRNGKAVRPDGRKIAFAALLKEEGCTPEELAKLAESEAKSNELVNIETRAFHAMEGRFIDEHGEYGITGPADQELARKLMFGDAYDAEKQKIAQPVREFQRMITERTEAIVTKYEHRSMQYHYSLLALLGFSVVVIIFSYQLITRKVLRALGGEPADMQRIALEIAQGHLTERDLQESKRCLLYTSDAADEQ